MEWIACGEFAEGRSVQGSLYGGAIGLVLTQSLSVAGKASDEHNPS